MNGAVLSTYDTEFRSRLVVGVAVSVIAHLAVGVALIGRGGGTPDLSILTAALPQPEEPLIRPGIARSQAVTINWLGFETPTPHEATQAEVGRQLEALERAEVAAQAIERRGGIVVVPELEDAFELANAYAPEHLCLLLREPWQYVGKVRNAGGIFLGERSFEVLGDYVAGPSHIMPTGGTARYASPVNVDDFRKVISLVGLNEAALRRIGPAAARLADAEGLTAHAAAVRARLAEQ